MSNIKLIMTQVVMDPPQYDGQMIAPLAVYAIGAYLQQNDIDVTVIDPHIFRAKTEAGELKQLIESDDVVFAFSVNSFNWPATRKIISQLKKINPAIRTIVGGIHASYFPEQILMASECDIVSLGEAELCLLGIIRALEDRDKTLHRLKELAGVAYRSGDAIVVNPPSGFLKMAETKPVVPAYDFAPDNLYQHLSVETSRGCTANCAFCSIAYKSHWRCYPEHEMPEYFEHMIASLAKTGAHGFYFVDDCFTANVPRAVNILDQFQKLGFSNIPIGIEARINNLLHTELLEKLSGQNLWLVQTGVECGYTEGIERVNKKTTLENIVRAAAFAKQFSINHAVMFSFIVGLPWENYDDCLKTIHFAAEVVEKYRIVSNISWHTLLPSRLWSTRNEYGIPFDNTIFNEDQWFLSKDYFHKTKPFLSVKEYMKLETIIGRYCDAGIPLRGLLLNNKPAKKVITIL